MDIEFICKENIRGNKLKLDRRNLIMKHLKDMIADEIKKDIRCETLIEWLYTKYDRLNAKCNKNIDWIKYNEKELQKLAAKKETIKEEIEE